MSSELTETERQSMPASSRTPTSSSTTTAYRRARFARTSSLENIKKTFMCAQNYFFLPALLAWLRSSQDNLQTTLKTCIVAVKSTAQHVVRRLADNLLVGLVYATVAAIFLQLAACLYVLSVMAAIVPTGLLFLIGCLYYISHINLKCLKYIQQCRPVVVEKIQMSGPRISRKDILGKRTISNFNFF